VDGPSRGLLTSSGAPCRRGILVGDDGTDTLGRDGRSSDAGLSFERVAEGDNGIAWGTETNVYAMCGWACASCACGGTWSHSRRFDARAHGVRDSRAKIGAPAMTNHGFFFTTRRHFMQATAAASAVGLWAESASAGPAAAGVVAGNFAVELGGKTAGFLSAVTIAEHLSVPGNQGGAFGLGQFAASYSISEANQLVDWIMSLPRKQVQEKDGAIIFTDHNSNAKRRVEWTDGLITSVQFPKLSATENKKPFAVDVKWQPSTVSHFDGGDKKVSTKGAGKGAKALSASSFRLKGLPAESDFVTSIALPLVSTPDEAGRKGKEKAGIKIGDVAIEFSGRSRDSVYKYVQGVIEDGNLTDKEFLDLAIELLDPTLTKTLSTVQLFGCGLRSYKEGKIESGSESLPKFTLTFSVERFDLVL